MSEKASPMSDDNSMQTRTGTHTPNQVIEVLDGYLADLQAGKKMDRRQLLEAHPELAAQLEPCLAGLEFIQRATQAADQPAQLGDFRILREVGRGGMGVVYEAEQMSLKRRVALKVLRFGAAPDTEALRRFQREAETVARLHHTNIVPIFAVGCEHQVHFYAMQFIEGQSLADRLKRDTACEPREVARWGLQAAEALAYAHERGVVHRDIKPSNLMLDPQNIVWLTDFGLAKRTDEVALTMSGALLGTPRYMSPEQASELKQPIDHRTDIYSLGATLYELATGKPVFNATTPHGVIAQILNQEPAPPRQLRGDVPRDLETIILKCLAKEPQRRYVSAHELADDLRAMLDGRAIRARRTTIVEKAVRWARKQRRSTHVAGVAAAASLLAMTGLIFLWTWYASARLAHLSIQGPPLKAEVLDRQGTLVARFTAPTEEAQALLPAAYDVRFSAAGRLSETYRYDADWGEHDRFHAKLDDRKLWEIGNTQAVYEMVNLEGRDDLLLFEATGEFGNNHVARRIDGGTGSTLWQFNPSAPDVVLPIEDRRFLLQSSNHFPRAGTPPALVRPLRDLDGDGVPDLIIGSRRWAGLLALSGKSGKLLWYQQAQPILPMNVTPEQILQRHVPDGHFTIGKPVFAEIDGEPVVLAAFGFNEELISLKDAPFVRVGKQKCVEAVAARSGKRLWRQPLPVDDGPIDTTFAAQTIKSAGREMVVLSVGPKVFECELKTGGEFRPCPDLLQGLAPSQTLRFVDRDRDGQADSVFADAALADLKSGALLWHWQLGQRLDSSDGYGVTSEPPLLVDLDNDGTPEVFLLRRRESSANPERVWSFFAPRERAEARTTEAMLLDLVSGKPRWMRTLKTSQLPGERFIAGNDLDGDGVRDIYLATMPVLRKGQSWQRSIFVDALSGKDGRSLWTAQFPLPGYASPWERVGLLAPLVRGAIGIDGQPELIVTYWRGSSGDSNDEATSLVLAGGSGQLQHLLSGFGVPTSGDLNGDGIIDLLGYWTNFRPHQTASGSLTALRGLPPRAWGRLGSLHGAASADLDGDRIHDLVVPNRGGTQALSGRNGETLWQSTSAGVALVVQNSDGDLNGDAVPDVLFVESNDFGRLQCLSGKTGERLWTANSLPSTGGRISTVNNQAPLLRCQTVERGQQPDVFAIFQVQDAEQREQRFWLSRFSGRDGRTLWQQPLHDGEFTSSNPCQIEPAFGELDGDGVLDVVTWVMTPKFAFKQNAGREENKDTGATKAVLKESPGFNLRAFSGRDGRLLWHIPMFAEQSFNTPRISQAQLPPPLLTDLDGDGIADVVVTNIVIKHHEPNQVEKHAEVMALSGRDGTVLWNWSGDDANSLDWPGQWTLAQPKLARLGKDRVICVSIHDQEKAVAEQMKTGRQLVLLDVHGKVRHAIDVHWTTSPGSRAPIWICDGEGDGRDELLFMTCDNVLHAATLISGDDKLLHKQIWQRPLLASQEVRAVQSANNNRPAALVLATTEEASGMNPVTGSMLWQCETPVLRLLADNLAEPPFIVGQDAGMIQCRRALPTTPNGKHLAPARRPLVLAATGNDPRLFRPLPWGKEGGALVHPVIAFLSPPAALAALVVPFLLLRWTMRGSTRRRWLVACGSAALVGAYYIGISSWFTDRGDLEVARFFPVTLLLFGILGLPVVVLGWSMWQAGRTRNWRTLAALALGVLADGAILAGLALHLDNQQWIAGEVYTWADWYWITGPAIYVAAILYFMAMPIVLIARSISQRTSRS